MTLVTYLPWLGVKLDSSSQAPCRAEPEVVLFGTLPTSTDTDPRIAFDFV